MGQLYVPAKVLPIGGLMAIPAIALSEVISELESYFQGEIITSPGFNVQEYTNYYDAEMGAPIKKFFYYAKKLCPVEGAEQWKKWAINREKHYTPAGSDNRPVNIDPGYLTLSKLVLFSTKGYAHRVYIRHRIYAEVTLQYMHKEFHSLPWTYRDYCSPGALEFWYEARKVLDSLLKQDQETSGEPGIHHE